MAQDARDPLNETSFHVRQAAAGDVHSVGWIVEHLTPVLLAQARYRLGRHLQGLYDPEDLVQEVWTIGLSRLGELLPRDGRYAPVLLRFLGTTLLRSYHHLVEKHLAGKPREVSPGTWTTGEASGGGMSLPADVSGIVTKACRRESASQLNAVIEAMAPSQREILILRALEEMPYALITKKLGVDEQTLRARYHRALQSLRPLLPPSMVDELAEA